jgi:hypothetical protein
MLIIYRFNMKSNKLKSVSNNHTRRRKLLPEPPLCGFLQQSTEGWVNITIYGGPYERGFAHGYLLKNELRRVKTVFPFLITDVIEVSVSNYMKECSRLIKPILKKHFPEYYTEIVGISAGAKKAGLDISVNVLIGWNAYMSMYSYFVDGGTQKCSAFIATGDATEKGDIVMAHNTHTDFASGQLQNIILTVIPTDGNKFVMQTSPGCIASGTDWFVCANGLIGCETTIGDINFKPKFGYPYFCRIRQSMQYGNSLEDYKNIMLTKNAGDYACSWLFGDINTNEIMLCEIGLTEVNVQTTKNGVYYGMNSAISNRLRKNETDDVDYNNISSSSGARNRRLNELLNVKYDGKINSRNAMQIIADHYDVYMQRSDMNSRGICNHFEDDIQTCCYDPFALYGCTDAKVVNTKMAKSMSFYGRFGSACGRKFSIKKHVAAHPEYKNWARVVDDIPSWKWVKIQSGNLDKYNSI